MTSAWSVSIWSRIPVPSIYGPSADENPLSREVDLPAPRCINSQEVSVAENSVRGRFVWHELMTTDIGSAADFYGKIVGWKTKGWEQDEAYVMFVMGKSSMAGLMTLPKDAQAMGAAPSWVTYIGTPNVDATVAQAVSLGGKIVKDAADIPTVGRFAVLQDPQGATFLAFTPLQSMTPIGDPGVPVVGDFSWHELVTTDWRAGLAFYKALFGWEETESMDMGPEMGTYQMFGLAGKTFAGAFNKPANMPGPPFWLPYIKVADATTAAASTTRLGGHVMNGPMQVPGGDWIAQGADLEGAAFAVHSAKPAQTAQPAAKTSSASSARAKIPSQSAKTAPKKKAAAASSRIVSRKKSAGKAARRVKKMSVKAGKPKAAASKKKAKAVKGKPLATAKRPAPRKKASAPRRGTKKKSRR
jgi:hypothetical protein